MSYNLYFHHQLKTILPFIFEFEWGKYRKNMNAFCVYMFVKENQNWIKPPEHI